MKNMFKMMGVALLAGAMLFTACKKDEETTTTTPAEIADGVTVNFGGATWTSNTATAVVANNHLQITAYKTVGQFPGIQIRTNAQEGTVSGNVTEDENAMLVWSPLQEEAYVYYNATEQTDGLGDWLPLTYTVKVTKFDATNLKISAAVDAQLFDYKSWSNDDVNLITDAAKKTLTATFGNITFAAAQ